MSESSQEIATESAKNQNADTITISKKSKRLSGSKLITYTATLVALTLVLKIVGNMLDFGFIKITLTYTPWVISALTLGPMCFAVSLITDILSVFILGQVFIPLVSVGNTLFPLIVWCALKLPLKHNSVKILIGLAIALLVCTWGINSYALYDFYYRSMGYVEFFISIRIMQPIIIGVNAVIILMVLPALEKLGLVKK